MTTTQQPITPSGVVYLFGERFVEPAKMTGETLLSSGIKVKGRELAEMLYGVALLALEANGVVRLELVKRKSLLGLGSRQTVAVTRLGSSDVGGLEGVILPHLLPDARLNDVPDLVIRHLGQDMADPWAEVTGWVKRALVVYGFLREEREARRGLGKLLGDKVTLHPVPERIAPLAGAAERVRALLADNQARRPELMAQLWKDLRKGYSAREEKPDTGSDD